MFLDVPAAFMWEGLRLRFKNVAIDLFHIYIYIYIGKNSQIPLFFEIISVLPLFEKYVAKYHFLELEFVMELEFIKIE